MFEHDLQKVDICNCASPPSMEMKMKPDFLTNGEGVDRNDVSMVCVEGSAKKDTRAIHIAFYSARCMSVTSSVRRVTYSGYRRGSGILPQ